MRILLTYSSKTGNTEMVAREILKEVKRQKTSVDFFRMEEAGNPEFYDFIILGFWINRGKPDLKTTEYIKKLHNKNVAFFFTLGASPNSEHAIKCLDKARSMLQIQNNSILGTYFCQGKIDEKLIEAFKSFPENHPQFYNEKNKKRYAEAASHPDEEDFAKAKATFYEIISRL